MSQIVSFTLPIFLLIALGFAAVRAGALDAAFIKGLGGFVLNFAMPALIVHALLAQDLRQSFNGSFLLVYALASLIVFILAFAACRFAFGAGTSRSAVAALGSSSSNSGFIGFPVASLATGKAALVALPMSLLVENVLIIPLSLALAEFGSSQGGRPADVLVQTVRRLARMPVVIAIVAGALMSGLGLQLPGPVSTAVGMIANAAIAPALIVVGGTLALERSLKIEGAIVPILIGKLVLHPLLVAGGFMLVGNVPHDLAVAGIVMASAPMLTVYPILGQRFGEGPLCATALVVVTATGFFTMTLMLTAVGTPAP